MKKVANNIEQRFFDTTLEVRTNEDGTPSRTIVGVGAVTNSWSKTLGGWFREIIEPGAFDDVDFSRTYATFNHNNDNILARVDSNTLQVYVNDDGHLEYRFEAPNTTAGNDLLENVRNGNVKGSSFTFNIPNGGDTWEQRAGGIEERRVHKVKTVPELGPVTNPAYTDTTAARRSFESANPESKLESTLSAQLKYEHLRTKF